MSLETVELDDLTWDQLTEAARDRIPSASAGQWTLHAPVDPGITLIELFAAQLEQRLYWMNQSSDATTQALLALIGVSPKPVQSAGTVVSFPGQNSKRPIDVPPHTELVLDSHSANIKFRTAHDLSVLPILWPRQSAPARRRKGRTTTKAQMRIRVGEFDRTNDLLGGQSPCLFSTVDNETRIAFRLNDDAKIDGISHPFSVLFDLDVPDTIKPQWAADDSKISSAKSIAWRYAFVDDVEVVDDFLDAELIDDGTLGFRRSGVVRLKIDENAAIVTPKWLVISLVVVPGEFSVLPRVKQIVPNAAIAEHRLAAEISPASDDLKVSVTKQIENLAQRRLPGGKLTLPLSSDELPIPDTVTLELEVKQSKSEDDESNAPWTAVSDFSKVGSKDRVFIVHRDKRQLLFGDGLNGATSCACNSRAILAPFRGRWGCGRKCCQSPGMECLSFWHDARGHKPYLRNGRRRRRDHHVGGDSSEIRTAKIDSRGHQSRHRKHCGANRKRRYQTSPCGRWLAS